MRKVILITLSGAMMIFLIFQFGPQQSKFKKGDCLNSSVSSKIIDSGVYKIQNMNIQRRIYIVSPFNSPHNNWRKPQAYSFDLLEGPESSFKLVECPK